MDNQTTNPVAMTCLCIGAPAIAVRSA